MAEPQQDRREKPTSERRSPHKGTLLSAELLLQKWKHKALSLQSLLKSGRELNAEMLLFLNSFSDEYKQEGSKPQLPADDPDNAKSDDNCPELVLKVRIQSHKENDFIEVELDRQKLSYQNLLKVSCCELGINPEQVEKIRKLPNTLLRKDKDILRLRDSQEVELILRKNGSSEPIEYTPSLIEKPCCNSNAAKLTY
ncbi:putative ANKRD40 C-terminal-like protein [Phacochoerus africanus]|uniref:putative ANKRD40 C-terminal-like protein n=1 Tax=Phacochoerus africanus TaxID=41426 RepID=UPI001FD98D40|nr:putative ANKRD40 C-terminal-like protein [Phacochoerus africanus]